MYHVFKNWLSKIRLLAKRHNLSPKVFIALYFFSFLPFYLGIALMTLAVKSAAVNKAFHFKPLFLIGFIINQLAWALPYLYIVIKGKNINWKISGLVWGWIIGSIGFFIWQTFF